MWVQIDEEIFLIHWTRQVWGEKKKEKVEQCKEDGHDVKVKMDRAEKWPTTSLKLFRNYPQNFIHWDFYGASLVLNYSLIHESLEFFLHSKASICSTTVAEHYMEL